VLDDNRFLVNQAGHAYQGFFPYTAARSAGLGFWTSSAYAAASSAIWEIVGETEPPALNDQLTTTLGGPALGEALHRIATSLRGGGRAGRAAAFVLDPFAEVNRRLVAERPAEPAPRGRSALSAGAAAWTAGRGGELRPLLAVQHRAGLPGDPELRLRRPFDHFALEASYAAASDLGVRVRGLLAGRTFGRGAPLRGLWGLFLSFHLDTPRAFRSSASALGLGVSASRDLPRGLAIEGTALASGVLMGAAGDVQSPGLRERDYVLGPGAEGLLELRLDAGERLAATVGLHQVAIVGAERRQGEELVLESRGGLLFRVAGRHALGVEYADLRRFARAPLAATRRRGEVVSLCWTVGEGRWLPRR
jgi:hypothetical protein